MSLRARTPLIKLRRTKRCPRCGKLVRIRKRCKSCHTVLKGR